MPGYDEAIESLLVDYQNSLDKLSENQQKMKEIRGKAASKRKSVELTVDAQSQLVELKFPTDAYKKMAPIELANVITETFTAARAIAAEQATAIMLESAPPGIDVSALFGPDSDITKVLPREPGDPAAAPGPTSGDRAGTQSK